MVWPSERAITSCPSGGYVEPCRLREGHARQGRVVGKVAECEDLGGGVAAGECVIAVCRERAWSLQVAKGDSDGDGERDDEKKLRHVSRISKPNLIDLS